MPPAVDHQNSFSRKLTKYSLTDWFLLTMKRYSTYRPELILFVFLIIRTRSLFISWLADIRRLMQFDKVKEFNQQNVAFLVQSEICCSKYVILRRKKKEIRKRCQLLVEEKKDVVIINIVHKFSSLYCSGHFLPASSPGGAKGCVLV